jgi:hypothetical protein
VIGGAPGGNQTALPRTTAACAPADGAVGVVTNVSSLLVPVNGKQA